MVMCRWDCTYCVGIYGYSRRIHRFFAIFSRLLRNYAASAQYEVKIRVKFVCYDGKRHKIEREKRRFYRITVNSPNNSQTSSTKDTPMTFTRYICLFASNAIAPTWRKVQSSIAYIYFHCLFNCIQMRREISTIVYCMVSHTQTDRQREIKMRRACRRYNMMLSQSARQASQIYSFRNLFVSNNVSLFTRVRFFLSFSRNYHTNFGQKTRHTISCESIFWVQGS